MKGDFLGFSFDGTHSKDLGIVHVSSSDRYDENLFPEIKDKTVEIPSNHGEYYYNSTYGVREIHIDIAYDSVTETQFREIRRLFGTRKICELIFDERPYKVYYAKVRNPIELSYVCFDERARRAGETIEEGGIRWISEETTVIDEETGEEITTTIRKKEDITPWVYEDKTQRIYKGEGSIDLVCYFPFARQLFKTLDLYENNGNLVTNYTNVDEWAESSGLLTEEIRNTYHIDRVVPIQNNDVYNFEIPVYNPGDLNVGFCLYIPFDETGKICAKAGQDVIIINGDKDVLFLTKEIERKDERETGIMINTNNHLIEGVSLSQVAFLYEHRKPSWQTVGTIYNECIKLGDFPYIKRKDKLFDDVQDSQAIYISCSENNGGIGIYYNYLYF